MIYNEPPTTDAILIVVT